MSTGPEAFVPILVIPVFNEAETIGEVVAAARAHAPVLVVDDGSEDESAAIARRAGAEVFRHPRRLGKGQAIRTGVAAARSRGASVVVTLDGDGQHDPGDLAAVLGAARRTPGAIVAGSRLAEPSALEPDRLNAIRVAGFFVNWASGLALTDTQSGYRAYPVTLFDEVELRHGGFVLETEVLIAAAGATLAAPGLLVLLALQALAPRWFPDVVTPLVQRLCSQTRLDPAREPEHGPLVTLAAPPKAPR